MVRGAVDDWLLRRKSGRRWIARVVLGRLAVASAGRGATGGRESGVSAAAAGRILAEEVASVFAESTWEAKAGVWRRFRRWCVAQNIRVSGLSAALWVAATGVAAAAKLTYLRHLIGILEYLRYGTRVPRIYAKALEARGGTVPKKQAEPLLPTDLRRVLEAMDRKDRLALLLCWKTAARWGEVQQLHPMRDFVRVSPQRVVVRWGRIPKGRSRNPFVPSAFAVIEGPGTSELSKGIAALRRQGCTKLTGLSTRRFAALIKKVMGNGYSAHSVRRGALSHLQGVMAEGRGEFGEVELARLAKHQSKADPYPVTSIRYGWARPLHLALSLKTGKVTRCLPVT